MITQVWLDVFAMIVYYLCGWEDESWELLQVFQIKFPSERPHSGISWPYEFWVFLLCACVCFCKHVAHVCLHGLCLHNAVFCSAGCAGVQQCSGCTWPRLYWKVYVFHVLCSVLKSGSKDDRMNPICYDAHTMTCTSLSEKWLLGFEW